MLLCNWLTTYFSIQEPSLILGLTWMKSVNHLSQGFTVWAWARAVNKSRTRARGSDFMVFIFVGFKVVGSNRCRGEFLLYKVRYFTLHGRYTIPWNSYIIHRCERLITRNVGLRKVCTKFALRVPSLSLAMERVTQRSEGRERPGCWPYCLLRVISSIT